MQSCLVFAARYAHNRQTAGAFVVVNAILESWDELTPETKKQLIKEASYDATCNHEDWEKLISLDGILEGD